MLKDNIKNIKNNKKIKICLFSIIIIGLFSTSYYFTFNKSKSSENINNNNKINADKTVTAPSNNVVIPKNATIVFTVKSVKYNNENSDDEITSNVKVEKKEKNKFSGMNIEEVESKFSDKKYKVININKSEVILQREMDYFPNIYIVGENDGFIAIFKTDEDGNKHVQEVTARRVEECLPYDQKKLQSGMQFNTREKAEDEVMQLIT